MRAALEVCGEFLSRIGALEGANAIAEILRKTGVELPETSAFRWRALLAAIRQELGADLMDVTFVFERMLQLLATKPSESSHALFGSPLFLHLLVERFAVAFEGLDAELFKLESDDLCQAEGIYEACLLIRDQIEEDNTESELTKFLAAFKRIFQQDEPKDCWDAFYDLHRLPGVVFRRDMRRALSVVESVTLGPTKLELAFPTKAPEGPQKVVPRGLLEKYRREYSQEWQALSRVYSIPGAEIRQPEPDSQEQEQEQPDPTGNEDTEPVRSEASEENRLVERPASARPPRARDVARADRQQARQQVPRRRMPRDEDGNGVTTAAATTRLGDRRPRMRWSAEEEAALIEGYREYKSYSNVWVLIKTKFPDVLQHRSNVDLKDKYRNLARYNRLTNNGDAGAPPGDVET